MEFLIVLGVFVISAILILIASIHAFEFNFGKKLFLFLGEISVSISIPIFIGKSFIASFPDYYKHGFMTGMGMLFIAFIMALLNIALFSTLLNSIFKKYISKNKNDFDYVTITLLMITIMIVLQVTFTFILENPS